MNNYLGDLLDVTEGYIFHQVNCRNSFGRGLSRSIADKWPKVKTAYHDFCEGKAGYDLLGQYQVVKIDDKLSVVNVFGQLNYGNSATTNLIYTDYQKFQEALEKFRVDNQVEDRYCHFPKLIGCGLAGGDWNKVSGILETLFPKGNVIQLL